ncbi:hypothetical protein [Baekduia sp. Peel2402]|uniref:hypothetical protein n=1 Tax=Baekduia sp. Peel2402 TaxID=3458296 RepID=UPI00403E9DF0
MLELRGAAPGLLDDPLLLEVGGAPPNAALTWRARVRDDDGFVWRASGTRVDALAWTPAKASAGDVAALRSLRPVDLDVRVEDPEGATASRTLKRTLLAEGVRARRWKDGVAGTLYLPAAATGGAAILDARATEAETTVPVAAALLASRGVLVFALTRGTPEAAREALAAVPSAPADVAILDAVPLPPGVPARTPPNSAAWDALLADLSARPRRVAR